MNSSAFKQELDAARRRMFPPSDFTHRPDSALTVLRRCRPRTVMALGADGLLYLWHPDSPTIDRYFADRGEWDQLKVGFDPKSQWFSRVLNANWSVCGTRVPICGGASFSEVDLVSGSLVTDNAGVVMPESLLGLEETDDNDFRLFALEQGQFQYSNYMKCWLYAYFTVAKGIFCKLTFDAPTEARLEILLTPDLPLSNFVDFPTRFLLGENGSKILLYNARPPQTRPAKNQLFSFDLRSLDLTHFTTTWKNHHVLEELETGDWRKRCHPGIDALSLLKDELLSIDYEWHFCHPDSGYGIFRICKLAFENNLTDQKWAHWEVLRELPAANDYLVNHLGLPNGAHLRSFDMINPDKYGRLFFIIYGGIGQPISVCMLYYQPKLLQLICASAILCQFPHLKTVQKSQLLDSLGLGRNTIERNFSGNPGLLDV